MNKEKLQIYEFRAVYAAFGPHAAEIFKTTFEPLPVDSEAAALSAPGASARAAEALADTNANFAIVPFDLGFPPERAPEQHGFFRGFASELINAGVASLALITTGSLAAAGSQKNSERIARAPGGGRLWYHRSAGRAAVCWSAPETGRLLRELSLSALEAGAAGIFLESLFFGAAPALVGNNLEGFAGCSCRLCSNLFREHLESRGEKPFTIPRAADLESEQFRTFARWRAGVVSAVLEDVMSTLKSQDSSALFCVSAPMLPYLPTLPMFGLDPQWALSTPDVCCLEHNRSANIAKEGLTYVSCGLRTLKASAARFAISESPEISNAEEADIAPDSEYTETLVAEIGWQHGPREDRVCSAEEYTSIIGTGLAHGCAPVIRAGEFREGKETTCDYLTAPGYEDARNSAASLFNWLEKNPDIFEDVSPASRTALLFSWERVSWLPGSILPAFHTLAQTMTEIQIPFVVEIFGEESSGKLKRNETKERDGAEGETAEAKAESKNEENDNRKHYLEVDLIIVPWTPTLEEARRIINKYGIEKKYIIAADGARELPAGVMDEMKPDVLPLEILKSTSAGDAEETKSGVKGWLWKRLENYLRAGSPLVYCGFPISLHAGMPPPLPGDRSVLCRWQPPVKWEAVREAVMKARENFPPDVTVEAMPFIHVFEWKKRTSSFFHIINILPGFPGPAFASLRFPAPVNARVIHPENGKIVYHNMQSTISVRPDPYAIVEVKNRYPK